MHYTHLIENHTVSKWYVRCTRPIMLNLMTLMRKVNYSIYLELWRTNIYSVSVRFPKPSRVLCRTGGFSRQGLPVTRVSNIKRQRHF